MERIVPMWPATAGLWKPAMSLAGISATVSPMRSAAFDQPDPEGQSDVVMLNRGLLRYLVCCPLGEFKRVYALDIEWMNHNFQV
jgi:hypothetical protein